VCSTSAHLQALIASSTIAIRLTQCLIDAHAILGSMVRKELTIYKSMRGISRKRLKGETKISMIKAGVDIE